jgi:hypothetical protein
MKKLFSTILISAALASMVSCKKKDADVISAFEQLGVGSYVTLVKNNNLILDYSNINTTSAEIVVKEYGDPVEKIKIYVTAGAASRNRATWKLVKEVAYGGAGSELTLNVKATEIATALGIAPTALQTGGTYTLYNQVINKNGESYDIANMQSDFPTLPNYNMAMTWSAVVVCPYQAAQWGGVGAQIQARVLQDQWADYSVGDIIGSFANDRINLATATSIRFDKMWLTDPSDTRPVTVNVAATTGAATVPATLYGDYVIYGPSYDDVSCQTSGPNNWVFSCVNQITLTLNHFKGSLNHGTYIFRLQKL